MRHLNQQVFVSHASADVEKVKDICAKLNEHNIQLWASFKDIPPGAKWDQAIQDALEASSHVLVIASQTSINSSYVRTEIEYALDNDKIVIPILIEDLKLPLRWHTLQYFDYAKGGNESLIQLAEFLPKNTVKRFEELLNEPHGFDNLKELLYENAHWIQAIVGHVILNQRKASVRCFTNDACCEANS
jgi:hypothetical protein